MPSLEASPILVFQLAFPNSGNNARGHSFFVFFCFEFGLFFLATDVCILSCS